MLPTDVGAVRFANTDDMDVYMSEAAKARLPLSQCDPDFDLIGREQAFEESLFLGLRLNRGVYFDALRAEFGEAMLHDTMPALREVSEAGLLEMKPDWMRLTSRGRMVSNEVFSRLLIDSAA